MRIEKAVEWVAGVSPIERTDITPALREVYEMWKADCSTCKIDPCFIDLESGRASKCEKEWMLLERLAKILEVEE